MKHPLAFTIKHYDRVPRWVANVHIAFADWLANHHRITDTITVQWYARMRPQIPECHTFSEVVNESWPSQDQQAAAKEMYRSWKLSPGHWSAVNGRCRYYGYAMCLSDSGIWYACGIFAE